MQNAINHLKLETPGIFGCIHSPRKTRSKKSDIKNGLESILAYIATIRAMAEDEENQKIGKKNGGNLLDRLRKKYTLMIQKYWS